MNLSQPFQISTIESDLFATFCLKRKISQHDIASRKLFEKEKTRFILAFESQQFRDLFINTERILEFGGILLSSYHEFLPYQVILETDFKNWHSLSEIDGLIDLYFDAPLYLCQDDQANISSSTQQSSITPKNVKIATSVALIDSGVDTTRHELHEKVEHLLNLSSESELDFNGHGTFIASILAGMIPNSPIKDDFDTELPFLASSTIYSVKIFNQEGTARLSDFLCALYHLEKSKHDFRIILMPATSGPLIGYFPLFEDILDKLEKKGIICVCAAGNFGPEAATMGCPGSFHNVVTVGSLDQENHQMFYSSRAKFEIEDASPNYFDAGTRITGLASSQGNYLSKETVQEKYITLTGTSVAAALVTIKISILKKLYPNLTKAQIDTYLSKINEIKGKKEKIRNLPFPIEEILLDLGWIKAENKKLLPLIFSAVSFSSLMVLMLLIAFYIL